MEETVLRGWPWLGLAIAVPMLAVMLARPQPGRPWRARWHDPAWLLWLPLPIYMLHQFEEHGIDALGRAYAFRGFLCGNLGWTGPLADCPATEWFVFGVNPGTVWIAGLASGIYGPKRVGATPTNARNSDARCDASAKPRSAAIRDQGAVPARATARRRRTMRA